MVSMPLSKESGDDRTAARGKTRSQIQAPKKAVSPPSARPGRLGSGKSAL